MKNIFNVCFLVIACSATVKFLCILMEMPYVLLDRYFGNNNLNLTFAPNIGVVADRDNYPNNSELPGQSYIVPPWAIITSDRDNQLQLWGCKDITSLNLLDRLAY
jgi:hypothetical protein